MRNFVLGYISYDLTYENLSQNSCKDFFAIMEGPLKLRYEHGDSQPTLLFPKSGGSTNCTYRVTIAPQSPKIIY